MVRCKQLALEVQKQGYYYTTFLLSVVVVIDSIEDRMNLNSASILLLSALSAAKGFAPGVGGAAGRLRGSVRGGGRYVASVGGI